MARPEVIGPCCAGVVGLGFGLRHLAAFALDAVDVVVCNQDAVVRTRLASVRP